jgi:hypothetical protein
MGRLVRAGLKTIEPIENRSPRRQLAAIIRRRKGLKLSAKLSALRRAIWLTFRAAPCTIPIPQTIVQGIFSTFLPTWIAGATRAR